MSPIPVSPSSTQPRLLIISSCTGEKASKPANQLTLEDFQAGSEHLLERGAELRDTSLPAGELYTGSQHLQLMDGLRLLRAKQPQLDVTLKIISAGFGLINEDQMIPPYEVTFNTMSTRDVNTWAQTLHIHEDLNAAIATADIVVFLLGENYLRAAKLPLEARADQTFVFLVSGKVAERLPQHAAKQVVMPLGNPDAKSFKYGLVGLKGFLFKQLAQELSRNPAALLEWHEHPTSVLTFLESRRGQTNTTQTALFELPAAAVTLHMHRAGLNYNPDGLDTAAFFPPSQHTLTHPPRTRFTVVINNRDKLRVGNERRRLWHFLEQTPRGFLTSLKYHHTNNEPLPGSPEGDIYDCGAWSYKHEPYPILNKKDGPLTAELALRMFDACQVHNRDILVAPDMMILGDEDAPTKARKLQVTLEMAKDFIKLARGRRAMAVAHGEFEDRHRMIEAFLEMGYTHIALGGLAMKSSRDPKFVYQCVQDLLSYRKHLPELYVHVLGVSSIKWAGTLTRLGVDSFDGSSMYMTAFTGGNFLRYDPTSPEILRKYHIVANPLWSDELPECPCPACTVMRQEGWDTRAQGGKADDPSGRPYNGGNEANMGRAVHNINMYLRALNDVQARVMAGDETLLIARHMPMTTSPDVQLVGA
jgi:Queuine tRNA-ribosyltransferase